MTPRFLVFLFACSASAATCVQPLCVNRIDDDIANPVSGMLRYAVLNAPKGATITFDQALTGLAITLQANHIKIAQDLTILGPGSSSLTISGGNATRIFFIAGGTVTISGLTLANGLARGGNGGGGAAGMGGAIFLNGGLLKLNSVMLSGNGASGGAGGRQGAGFGVGGGGFAGDGSQPDGGSSGDLGGTPPGGDGVGGRGGISQQVGGGLCNLQTGGAGGFGAGGGGGSGGSGICGISGGGPGGFGGGGGTNGGQGGFGGGNDGGGGAGMGGAIFANSGSLLLSDTMFVNNTSLAGTARAKGGSLFVCSVAFCGTGHDASVMLSGATSFQGSVAADAGTGQTCPGRDDADVCGYIASSTVTHFLVSAPASAVAGVPFTASVAALDANNIRVFTYAGTVHFASTDPSAGLPVDSTLTNGSGSFSITLRAPGNQTITAADSANPALTGTSGAIQIPAATPTHFSVSGPTSVLPPGSTFAFTVKALDANNLVVVGYSGPVHFSSSDPAAVLPADSALANGTGSFQATLNTGGPQTITVADKTNPSIAGVSNPIQIEFGGALAPSSVSPASGSVASQQFAFTFYDPLGWQDLSVVNVLINNFLDGRHACYLAYVVSSQSLLLVDDAGDAAGPFAGSQNSQCAATLVSAAGNGPTLTLTVGLTFQSAFAGNKIAYMAARDSAQNNSGWHALGVWQVPGSAAGKISVVGASPSSGGGTAGVPQPFTFTFSDTAGVSDLGIANVLINSAIDGRAACYLAFDRSTNALLLVDDAGDAGGPYSRLVLNGAGSPIENSQCAVAATSSSTVSGNTLTLNLNLVFKSSFKGDRVVYAAARDNTGGSNTDWQAVGAWQVR